MSKKKLDEHVGRLSDEDMLRVIELWWSSLARGFSGQAPVGLSTRSAWSSSTKSQLLTFVRDARTAVFPLTAAVVVRMKAWIAIFSRSESNDLELVSPGGIVPASVTRRVAVTP